MLSQRRQFASNPKSSMQFHPWRGGRQFGPKGIVVGINMKTGRVVMFHPWWMKKMELIDSPDILIDGMRGAAKSGLAKIMTGRLMTLAAGNIDGVQQVSRGRMNSRKRIDGDPEEKAFNDFLESDIIDLSQYAPNIFDPLMKLSPAEVVRTAIINGQFANNHVPLNARVKTAYQLAGMLMMEQFPRNSSQQVFADILARLDIDKIVAYHKDRGRAFREKLQADLTRNPNDALTKSGIDAEDEKELRLLETLQESPTVIESDAALRHEYMQGITEGVNLWSEVTRLLGSTGGTQSSIYEPLTRQMTTFDWSLLDEDQRSIFEINFNTYSDAGQNHGLHQLNAHVETWDEEQEGSDNLTHLQSADRKSRKARHKHTTRISATQYELTTRYAGEAGSDMRRYSIAINDGVSIHCDGRQPNTPEYHEWNRIKGYTKAESDYLCTKIPRGCFGFKVRNLKPVFVQAIRTPDEVFYTETDTTEAQMTDDDVVAEMIRTSEIWHEVMKARGVEYIGQELIGQPAKDFEFA